MKKSIDAYVGCVAGALLKTDYISIINSSGFTDVQVLNEKSFPVSLSVNDPLVKSLVDTLGMDQEEINDLSQSVISLEISGRKVSSQ